MTASTVESIFCAGSEVFLISSETSDFPLSRSSCTDSEDDFRPGEGRPVILSIDLVDSCERVGPYLPVDFGLSDPTLIVLVEGGDC